MPAVREILDRKGSSVITVSPDATVLEAAQLMNQRGTGSVLVLEGGALCGILTERDLLRKVVAEQRDPARTAVGEVMTRALVTCTPDMSLEQCAAIITERRIRHLPVVGADGLCGMVTIGDVMAFELREKDLTIQQLNSYVYNVR
jgi:CBS domain-containing protein